MKKLSALLVSVFALLFIAGNAVAVETLIMSVAQGCEKELTSYCSQVTPGEGRALACLYAHNDKISGKCEFALYDAAAQLERFVSGLTYVANECEGDLNQYCESVRAGEGRLAECLLVKNKDKISERCSQAIQDVDLTYEKE